MNHVTDAHIHIQPFHVMAAAVAETFWRGTPNRAELEGYAADPRALLGIKSMRSNVEAFLALPLRVGLKTPQLCNSATSQLGNSATPNERPTAKAPVPDLDAIGRLGVSLPDGGFLPWMFWELCLGR